MITQNKPRLWLKAALGMLTLSVALLVFFELFENTNTLAQAVRSKSDPSQAKRVPELAKKAQAKGERLAAESEENRKPAIGQFGVDMPDDVEIGAPFKIDIWVVPTDSSYAEPVNVFMGQAGSKVIYQPRVLEGVKPRVRHTVQVTIVSSQSGLAEISASADGFDELVQPIDANFKLKVKPTNLAESLTSGQVFNTSFDFVNSKGDRVPLDVPVTLLLESSDIQFRFDSEQPWANQLKVEVKRSTASSPAIQIKPRWRWSTRSILIDTTVSVVHQDKTQHPVFRDNLKLNIVPRWWLSLGVAILGGIGFSLYQASQDWTRKTRRGERRVQRILLMRILPGALAGSLAYFLVSLNVLGINIDTTAWQGFLVLGFLFAYVGIDTILKLVTRNAGDSPKQAHKTREHRDVPSG